jgi:hypothetical protein
VSDGTQPPACCQRSSRHRHISARIIRVAGAYHRRVAPYDNAPAWPAHEPSVLAEELDDELCLYLARTSDVAVLNRTAAEVWDLADGRHTPAEISAGLADRYGQVAAVLLPEVRSVLDDLTARGFLVPGPGCER